jgi:hypothetical protein
MDFASLFKGMSLADENGTRHMNEMEDLPDVLERLLKSPPTKVVANSTCTAQEAITCDLSAILESVSVASGVNITATP